MARGDLSITQSGEGGVMKAVESQLQMLAQRALVAMAIEANVIMLDAQRRCPVDDSDEGAKRRERTKLPHLRDTVTVRQLQRGRKVGHFIVEFKHPAAKYVHYDLSNQHANGEARFLQNAMDYAKKTGLVDRVANKAKVG